VPAIDLNPRDLEIVRAILRDHVPDREVWAFGSRVTGRAKPFSDLDLVIIGEQPLSSAVVGNLVGAFDESDLPFKVDLVDWSTTTDSFRKLIEVDRVIVQGRA
jgi:predicted nucleotidyltransferase